MSRAADLKRKKHRNEILALAETPKREGNGRASRAGKSRDPGIETLKARCRLMGKEITKNNITEMRAPWWGCYAGRVIGEKTMSEKDRADLWSAITHMRKVIVQHDAAIGLPKRHAVCMKLLDATAGGARVKDTRTPEERARQATSAMMQVEGWLGYVDKSAASEAKRVVIGDEYCRDEDGLLLALTAVSRGIKGLPMKYAGRKG